MIVNDRTFIPGHFVTETIGADVNWKPEIRAMVINTKKDAEPEYESGQIIEYEIENAKEISENETLSKWYEE